MRIELNLSRTPITTEAELNDELAKHWGRGHSVSRIYVNATTLRHMKEDWFRTDRYNGKGTIMIYRTDFGDLEVREEGADD